MISVSIFESYTQPGPTSSSEYMSFISFIDSSWVWARIIQNLATLGYDSNNIILSSYDWRLGFSAQETSDSYYSKLKSQIELAVKHSGEKAVIIAHSMGSSIFAYFSMWVIQNDPLGEEWLQKYLIRYINLSGPIIGLPKNIAFFLSGEGNGPRLSVQSSFLFLLS